MRGNWRGVTVRTGLCANRAVRKNVIQKRETLLSESFHHAGRHQAGFSVGKIDDSIFSVYFFYVILICQKRPMTAHKVTVQDACQFFHSAVKFNLTVFRMENDFMNITGSFKKENIIIIYADFSSADLGSIDLMRLVGLKRIAFHCM